MPRIVRIKDDATILISGVDDCTTIEEFEDEETEKNFQTKYYTISFIDHEGISEDEDGYDPPKQMMEYDYQWAIDNYLKMHPDMKGLECNHDLNSNESCQVEDVYVMDSETVERKHTFTVGELIGSRESKITFTRGVKMRTRKTRVAVIGSSKTDKSVGIYCQITEKLFENMVTEAEKLLHKRYKHEGDWETLVICSGGAAFSDHVAVRLFLKLKEQGLKLCLYLPCGWDNAMATKKGKFKENGKFSWAENPGKLSNTRHALFSREAKLDSLKEIQQAIDLGAEVISDFNGFHARNNAIAQGSDYLLAFTWSSESEPEGGGTRYTWDKSSCEKKHINVSSLDKPERKK